jgi:predicted flavoprotein YhiN
MKKRWASCFATSAPNRLSQCSWNELDARGAELWINTRLTALNKTDQGFALNLEREGQRYAISCRNLVIACGGKSIPKMGATGLAYEIAAQFQMNVTRTRPALVPLTFEPERFKPLAGIAIEARVSNAKTSFDEAGSFHPSRPVWAGNIATFLLLGRNRSV